MVAETSIRSAELAEISASLETLTRAFEADPVCNWAWPDRMGYRDAFPRFCGGHRAWLWGSHVAERL
jgi:hypothetical protein